MVSGGDVDPEVEARAIRDAVGAGARVINLSLGGNRDPKDPGLDEFSRAERDAISYAVKRGTVVVAAVGNSPDNAGLYASWPAALRHVIGVSAVTQTLAWAPFSNTDPVFNDIAAPGVGIITTVPRSLAPTGSSLDAPPGLIIQADGTVLGTSFAAPHVSAAAAVLLARHPDLTPTQVMWILEHTAHRLGDTAGLGRDRLTGFGLLDVTAAVKLADGPPAGLPPPDPDEPNDVAMDAQILPTSNGSVDAVADFGDDRRDVYKLYVHAGDTLRVRTEPLPLGGNLGLDVAIFPPVSTNLAGPEERAREPPPDVLEHLAKIRNSTAKDDFYYVQVSARRGWGAYRLHWPSARAVAERSAQAPSSSSGGTSRSTRAGCPTTTVRGGTSRSTIAPAPTNASSPISTPGSRIAAPPMRAPRRTIAPFISSRRFSVRPMKLSFVVTTQGAMKTSSSSSQ